MKETVSALRRQVNLQLVLRKHFLMYSSYTCVSLQPGKKLNYKGEKTRQIYVIHRLNREQIWDFFFFSAWDYLAVAGQNAR